VFFPYEKGIKPYKCLDPRIAEKDREKELGIRVSAAAVLL
jgi:hypothetical protein